MAAAESASQAPEQDLKLHRTTIPTRPAGYETIEAGTGNRPHEERESPPPPLPAMIVVSTQ